jgi:formate dehydrogenase maturation protein FdhE
VDPRAILDRWFGRPAPSPELASALGDLERLCVERPELSSPARSLADLLFAAFQGPESQPALGWDLESLKAGWREGRPAFHTAPPRLDETILVARMRRLVEALGTENDSAKAFARALRARQLDLMAWVAEVLAGRADEVARRAEAIGLDASLASSILRLTLLPSLTRISLEFDRIRPENAWDRGDCPNCSSRPLLAESRGLEQRIYYRCGLCAADWAGERLRCPSCGEVRAKSLQFSYVDGEQDRHRLAHCETCLYDWKVVSTLTALSPPAMIVADLATVHLDLLLEDRRGNPP